MSRIIKGLMIKSIQDFFLNDRDMFVVDVSRVIATDINRIRLDFVDRGIRLVFIKNAVAYRALSDIGLDIASQAFAGSSAIALGGGDVITLSKELMKCTELHKSFHIRSGIVDGRLLSSSDVEALSKSPGKSEILSQLSACILRQSKDMSRILLSYSALASQIDSYPPKE